MLQSNDNWRLRYGHPYFLIFTIFLSRHCENSTRGVCNGNISSPTALFGDEVIGQVIGQWLHHWSLGMDKSFHPTLYNGCNYLSMMTLKLNHVSKKEPMCLCDQGSIPHLLHFYQVTKHSSKTLIVGNSVVSRQTPPASIWFAVNWYNSIVQLDSS